jgi:exodeoxyribonuclease III
MTLTARLLVVLSLFVWFTPQMAWARSENASLKVMTFNTLYGGTKRGQPLSQTAEVILKAQADVVGLQEVGENAPKLAEMLGWHFVRHGWSAILTRFEIVEALQDGVRLRLPSGHELYVFNAHLRSDPYQPYQLLGIPYKNAPFIETETEAIASAQGARGQQVAPLLAQIADLPGADVPVFVIGDFNEPSHLDWTEAAARSGLHPIKVAFPSSRAMAGAGFKDAWREVFPDEIAKPGFTWTPVTKSDDPKDHHDRIDFIYYRGAKVVLHEVKIVGENQENADVVVTPYPSDHRAVVASLSLNGPIVSTAEKHRRK